MDRIYENNDIKNIKIEKVIIEDHEFNEIIKTEKFEETDHTNDNQSFKNGASQLTKHKRTRHPLEKPYKCKFCEQAFAQKYNLKTHKKTHAGEKHYKCIFCEQAFSTTSNLKRHKNTHTGEKRYSCDICGLGYADASNLKKHRWRSHTK